MRHKHADLIHAWAEGAEIEFSCNGVVWASASSPTWELTNHYRIKPEKKPDVVKWISLYQIMGDTQQQPESKIKAVFDGETGQLKSAEVLNANS